MKMFLEEKQVYNVPVEQWQLAKTVGDLGRNMLLKGQSVAELLDAVIVPVNTKEIKIIAWKYDEVFDVFLIKRVNTGFAQSSKGWSGLSISTTLR